LVAPDGGWSETWSTSPLRRAASTSRCPARREADWMGDGGGLGSSRGDVTSSVGSCVGEGGESASSLWPAFPREERPALPDLTDATSDFSPAPAGSPLGSPDVDALGLSVFAPGILDFKAPRNDLAESFVSALLKEGYDWRLFNPLSREV